MRERMVLTAPVFAAVAALTLTGCLATQSQLKHGMQVQDAALAKERSQRMAADSATGQDVASLRSDQQALRNDLQSLKTDLQSLRTEFGAKITALEVGMQFALPVHFAFDDATVRDEDRSALDRFAKVAQRYYPGSMVTVEGFADPAGSAQYNVGLSERRAESVKAYLVSQGLTGDLLRTVGYGKTRLVVPKAWGTQPGAEDNRRVVFVIETKGQKSVAMATPAEAK
jgi:peptidoglycan-associated lipoprotein